MDDLAQLEACANDLNSAVKSMTDLLRNPSYGSIAESASILPISIDAPSNLQGARRDILQSINRLQTMVTDPETLIRQLTFQIQLLSCLGWLGEFQILASVPLSGSTPIDDVADLMGVDKDRLARVVRTTATVGFLREPFAGSIAHTALSACFVNKPSYLDAIMFLADVVAPSALHMTAATKLDDHDPERPEPAGTKAANSNAYNLAFSTSQSFESAYTQQPLLQRQWPSFLRCTGDTEDSVWQLLSRLDWPNQGTVRIVDIGAESTNTAQALVNLSTALQFVVQPNASALITELPRPSHHILVQRRAAGSPQPIKDAAVYMLRVPSLSNASPMASSSGEDTARYITTELRAHLPNLRDRPSAQFLLVLRLVPEPGSVNPEVEAFARVWDLTKMQLTGVGDRDTAELTTLVNSVHDDAGRLAIVNKLQLPTSPVIAVSIKYKAAHLHSD